MNTTETVCPACGITNSIDWGDIGFTHRCQSCGLDYVAELPKQVRESAPTIHAESPNLGHATRKLLAAFGLVLLVVAFLCANAEQYGAAAVVFIIAIGILIYHLLFLTLTPEGKQFQKVEMAKAREHLEAAKENFAEAERGLITLRNTISPTVQPTIKAVCPQCRTSYNLPIETPIDATLECGVCQHTFSVRESGKG